MKCPVCNSSFWNQPVHNYIQHIKLHTVTNIICTHCNKTFTSVNSFSKHLTKTFPLNILPKQNEIREYENNTFIEKENFPLNKNNNNVNLTNNANISDLKNTQISNFTKGFLTVALSMFEINSLNRKEIFNNIKLIANQNLNLLNIIKDNVKFNENDINFINTLIDRIEEYSDLTEYKFLKFLAENNVYIPPETVLLSSNETHVLKDLNNVIKTENNCYQYISPIKIMGKILSDDYILSSIISEIEYYAEIVNPGTIESILQTPLWKQKVMNVTVDTNERKTLYVPIAIYADDIDPLNTLASHGGSYKIGLVYLYILCLPKNMRSKLDFYFLTQSYYSADQKDFGNHLLFKKLQNDLKYLQESGIDINYKGYTKVKFILTLITGDNLELHDLLGFCKSFNSNILCRFCYLTKEERSYMNKQVDHLLRNEHSYEIDLQNIDVRKSGLTETCIFNEIPGFNVTQNFYSDTMHDVLLGTGKYDCGYSLYHILHSPDNSLNIDLLNSRIRQFDYGPNRTNLIDTLFIDKLKNGSIKGSASEMLQLIIHLPLIIGDLIDENNLYFILILKVKELVVILLQKSYDKNLAGYVKHLVSEYLELYVHLFGNTLKYKHHLFTHIAMIISLIGPLIQYWCMRPESKNAIFKQFANGSNNRKNLILSLTLRHQLKFSSFLCKDKNYSDFETKIIGKVLRTELEIHFDLKLPLLFESFEYMNKFIYLGTIFCIGSVIQSGMEPDGAPLFSKICKILYISQNDLLLIIKPLTLIRFNRHLSAYQIKEEDDVCINYIFFSDITSEPKSYHLISKNADVYINYH